MFDKLRQAFDNRAAAAREMRTNPGPEDLMRLPPFTGSTGGLGAVPLPAAGTYVGMPIRAIRPLDALGAESASLIGGGLRERLRAAGVGSPDLEPGELVEGQNAARIERLRASGLSEEQIAAISDKIVEVTAAHRASGWTVEFENGNRASVELFESGSPDSGFTKLETEFATQHTRAGEMSMNRHPTEFAVERIDDAPYPAYYLPGRLVIRGRSHDARATASHLGTMQLDRTLTALGVLALHSLEG
jgi:hypothetical protein